MELAGNPEFCMDPDVFPSVSFALESSGSPLTALIDVFPAEPPRNEPAISPIGPAIATPASIPMAEPPAPASLSLFLVA
jgi:hypothetical protein